MGFQFAILISAIFTATQRFGSSQKLIAGPSAKAGRKGSLWQNILLSRLNRLSFSEVIEGRPVRRHHCEQCLACIQWCPQEAIQMGKKTPRYERYHHPDVNLKDIIGPRRRLEESNHN